jgi:hypothetical protein
MRLEITISEMQHDWLSPKYEQITHSLRNQLSWIKLNKLELEATKARVGNGTRKGSMRRRYLKYQPFTFPWKEKNQETGWIGQFHCFSPNCLPIGRNLLYSVYKHYVEHLLSWHVRFISNELDNLRTLQSNGSGRGWKTESDKSTVF